MVIAFVLWDDKKGDSCFEDTHRWQEERQCQHQRDITDPIIGRQQCSQSKNVDNFQNNNVTDLITGANNVNNNNNVNNLTDRYN